MHVMVRDTSYTMRLCELDTLKVGMKAACVGILLHIPPLLPVTSIIHYYPLLSSVMRVRSPL